MRLDPLGNFSRSHRNGELRMDHVGQRIGADIIRPHQWNVGHCTDSESIDHENDDPVEPAVRYWHGRFHL